MGNIFRLLGFYALILSLGLNNCGLHIDYDLLLKNATIYDGTGSDPITGSIGITGDRIIAIGKLEGKRARQEIDLKGQAVAPGFINMLSWAGIALLHDGRSQSDIHQGVTLEIMGEGTSMGPLNDAMKAKIKENQGDITYDITWTTLGEYLSFLEQKGVSTNVASFVGNGTIRQHVIGMENRPATETELEKMKALVREAMNEGAVGLSSALLYAPSMYADTAELIELAKATAEYDGMYISHIRSESDELLEAVEELIWISKAAAIPAEIYHLKASGMANWGKLDQVIDLVETARSEGHAISADMYTYPASSTGLHVQLPDWVREGGLEKAIERCQDPELREKILADMSFSNPPNRILLNGFRNDALKIYAGKRLDEVARERGVTPAEATIDLIAEDESRISVVYFSMDEANIDKKVALPWMSFCSDAGSIANEGVFIKRKTHPRAYGSIIRVLGTFVREKQILTLQEAVRKLSGLPAKNLKLVDRGLLKPGYFADVVVFDPAKVTDKATFDEPHQYAEGVIHVWVNGTQALKDGEHTGATPGRFVKGPGAGRTTQSVESPENP